MTKAEGILTVIDNNGNMRSFVVKPVALEIVECHKSKDGKHFFILPPDSFDNPYCKYCYKGS